ncbi:MAG: family 43 glycosylhydrolase [Thermoleophilaceae bacterium]
MLSRRPLPWICLAVLSVGTSFGLSASGSSAARPAKPKIALSRHSGLPGVRVRIRGRRFLPRSRLELRFGGRRLRKIRVRRSGRFRVAFRVPHRRAGLYRIVVRSRRGTPRSLRRRARARFRVRAAPASPAPAGSATPGPAPAPAATYRNPVYGSTPDPMAIRGPDGTYYVYSTGSLFPVARSRDLVSWTPAGTALPSRPSWVVPSGDSHPWAPSVLRSSQACPGAASGPCYLLYYVGLSGQHTPQTNCVAVATSGTAAGPFTDRGPLPATDGGLDQSGRPPGCGDDAGYSNIDPAPFVDSDGKAYLYVSTDRRCATVTPGGVCPYMPSISVIPLASDLLHAAGGRTSLFEGAAGTWEQEPGFAPTVENPWVVKRGTRYYLFYSGGYYRAPYGMGYAVGSSPTGPFAKSTGNPVLKEAAGVLSPGGGMVVRGPHGGDWLLYHGREGDYAQPRKLRIDPLIWRSDGTVGIDGPTSAPRSPRP